MIGYNNKPGIQIKLTPEPFDHLILRILKWTFFQLSKNPHL